MDYSQAIYPSNVRDGDVLGAAMVIRSQCVELEEPPFGGQAVDLGISFHWPNDKIVPKRNVLCTFTYLRWQAMRRLSS